MRLLSWLSGPFETLLQAAVTCRAHPLRSGLGALAIAVAVATLTLVETAVSGLALFTEKSASRAFGADTFVLAQVASPGQLPRKELAKKLERNPKIERSDVRFLERWAGDRVIYAPTAQRAGDVTAGGRKFESASLNGTGANLAEIRDLAVAQGRFFLPEEERLGAPVVVLGYDVAAELFPVADPLGQTVRIGGRGLTVVGVQTQQGTAGGVSLDRYAWMPLPAYERIFGAAPSLQISGRPTPTTPFDLAPDRARASMRARRQLAPGEEDNFDILTPEAARGFVASRVRRIGAVAPILSVMALLTAVVVVTNTTLVSVAQRTWEIGLRRALGARRSDIVREVLVEAILVSITGGAAGALVVSLLARAAAGPLGLDLRVEPRVLVMAMVASATAGLLAGLYPARKAARVDVITALRSE